MNCICDCGNEHVACLNSIKSGHTKSCGCSKKNNPLIYEDLTGQKFNRLTVLRRDIDRDFTIDVDENGHRKYGNAHWICKCECGNETVVTGWQLKSGHTKSCGCYNSEIIALRNKLYSSKYNRPEKYKDNILGEEMEDVIKMYDENEEFYFLIDAQDYEVVKRWYWRKITPGEEPNPRKRYWITNEKKENVDAGSTWSLRLHQLIAKLKYGDYDKKEVMPDHLSRNPDDNTRKNIFLKSNMDNSHNRGLSRANKSGKTGVYAKGNKYTATIMNNYKTYYLGDFNTFEEAVIARKTAEEQFGFTCDDIYPNYDIPINQTNILTEDSNG